LILSLLRWPSVVVAGKLSILAGLGDIAGNSVLNAWPENTAVVISGVSSSIAAIWLPTDDMVLETPLDWLPNFCGL